MLDFRSAVKYMAMFGAGVVTAGYFLSGPVLQPVQVAAPLQAPLPAATSSPAAGSIPDSVLFQPRSVRTIPFEKPVAAQPETTGAAVGEAASSMAAAPEEAGQPERASPPAPAAEEPAASCDRAACSRHYRSFDGATCTYKPYGGGPRRLCER